MTTSSLRLAALVSGSGSNLQSIIDVINLGFLDAKVVQVIASKDGIPAEARALANSIPYKVVARSIYGSDVHAMSAAITELLSPLSIDLILLCGYRSFIGESLLRAYSGRIMNIHPSLLPAFGGKGLYGRRVHQAVLDYGVRVSGCTVMFVDAGEDSGPIILQKAVPVEDDDTPETLAARVMEAETKVYPEAVSLFAAGRLKIEGRKVIITKGCLQ
ncbi:MAG: phosphoribosylglycinamide formyltransferase [Symbiobacteriaceae bacterium]|nr:phosphoribosylglycinamide formyltransferase [Symbiobacteriaceae bacterium]